MLEKDDGAYCLQRLLKYPPVENLIPIINLSITSRGKLSFLSLQAYLFMGSIEKILAAEAEMSSTGGRDPLGGGRSNKNAVDMQKYYIDDPLSKKGGAKTAFTNVEKSSTDSQDSAPIFFGSNFSKPTTTGKAHAFKAGEPVRNEVAICLFPKQKEPLFLFMIFSLCIHTSILQRALPDC